MSDEGINVKVLDSSGKVVVEPILESDSTMLTFEEFVQSKVFIQAVQEIAGMHKKSATEATQDVLNALLATMGETGFAAVDTVQEVVDDLIDVVAVSLKGLNKAGADLAKGIVNVATLNRASRK